MVGPSSTTEATRLSLQPTDLTRLLASRISDQIRADDAPSGTRLIERKLAEQLRVSRSPVRGALRLLEAEGIVAAIEGGGYAVAEADAPIPSTPQPAEEDLYHSIADDRLHGMLPDRVTENALIRRYDVTRAQLGGVLRRITAEGWMERLPGHGWAFLPMLTSLQSYEDSYRFRLTIEPAAILEPRFILNEAGLEACRVQQQRLVNGDIWTISKATLFDLNSHLHETIIECSQNSFFVEGLRRIDRVRRLIEYRQTIDRKHAVVRCGEHLHLIDLLLKGKRTEASGYLRWHLASVSIAKTIEPPASVTAEDREIR